MKRPIIILGLFALAACKEDLAAVPEPVELTAEAVGYYCQMELLDHLGPKGQVHLDGMTEPVFFSQVSDTIGYLLMPEQSHAVRIAYVQDMTGASWTAPGPWVAAEEAFYVLGSSRLGGMNAPEFVPFSSEEAARDFARLHGGAVRSFDQIESVTAPAASTAAPSEEIDISSRLKALHLHNGTN